MSKMLRQSGFLFQNSLGFVSFPQQIVSFGPRPVCDNSKRPVLFPALSPPLNPRFFARFWPCLGPDSGAGFVSDVFARSKCEFVVRLTSFTKKHGLYLQ